MWETRQLCVVWIIGIVIFLANGGSLGAVYAGRFIAGKAYVLAHSVVGVKVNSSLGIGIGVVVAPVYLAGKKTPRRSHCFPFTRVVIHILSEISPQGLRGLCTCTFTGAVYLGIMLAYFANWGASIHIQDGYNRWVCEFGHLPPGRLLEFLADSVCFFRLCLHHCTSFLPA